MSNSSDNAGNTRVPVVDQDKKTWWYSHPKKRVYCLDTAAASRQSSTFEKDDAGRVEAVHDAMASRADRALLNSSWNWGRSATYPSIRDAVGLGTERAEGPQEYRRPINDEDDDRERPERVDVTDRETVDASDTSDERDPSLSKDDARADDDDNGASLREEESRTERTEEGDDRDDGATEDTSLADASDDRQRRQP